MHPLAINLLSYVRSTSTSRTSLHKPLYNYCTYYTDKSKLPSTNLAIYECSPICSAVARVNKPTHHHDAAQGSLYIVLPCFVGGSMYHRCVEGSQKNNSKQTNMGSYVYQQLTFPSFFTRATIAPMITQQIGREASIQPTHCAHVGNSWSV